MMKALYVAAALVLAGCASGGGSGWVTLIDGPKGMENFNRVGSANWEVKDGAIQADRSVKDAGYLVTKKSYANFNLRVEFWASHDANSGIYMRCANPAVLTDRTCYEANIFDQRPDPTYGTGAIVHHAAVASPMPQAGGQWNVFEITARGNRITVVLNGRQTADLVHDQFKSGPIGLQWGRGVIKFRKMQIQEI
jgi:3-keto-disaccharide hydrolase